MACINIPTCFRQGSEGCSQSQALVSSAHSDQLLPLRGTKSLTWGQEGEAMTGGL